MLRSPSHRVPTSPGPSVRAGALAAVLASALLLGACAGYRKPSITLADVVRADTGAERAPGGDDAGSGAEPGHERFVFVLEGENTNEKPLKLRDVRYDVWIEGEKVLDARRSSEATLPPEGTQRFELPVPISDAQARSPSLRYRLRGNTEYLLPGRLADLLFDTRIQRNRAHFSFRGTLTNGDDAGGAPAPGAP